MAIETLRSDPGHFETYHRGNESLLCVHYDGVCTVGVEIDCSDEVEREALETATKRGFTVLDQFLLNEFSISSAQLFGGVHIVVGDGLTESGGQAFAEQKKIIFDRVKMSKSLAVAESEVVELGLLDKGDWTVVMSDDESQVPASCLEYNLVHELGHILGDNFDEVDVNDSPTKYGKTKPKEALAEAFTYLVYGQPIEPGLKEFILDLIAKRIS